VLVNLSEMCTLLGVGGSVTLMWENVNSSEERAIF
jgi:hypothetical protein